MTKAMYTVPVHVETWVKSATHNRFGAGAKNRRWTRSGARLWPRSGIVVRGFLPYRAPSHPCSR